VREKWSGIEVSADEETAAGTASDMVVIRPGDEAVVLDFLLSNAYSSQATLQSRIVLTAGVARQLKQALERTLDDEAESTSAPTDEMTYN